MVTIEEVKAFLNQFNIKALVFGIRFQYKTIMRRILPFILLLLFLAACDRGEAPFTPGALYKITTEQAEGYATFTKSGRKNWKGTFYEDKGNLFASEAEVKLKLGKDRIMMEFAKDNQVPIESYSLYEAPLFQEFPGTWEYKDSVYAVSVQDNIVYAKARGFWTSYPDKGDTFLSIYMQKLFEKDQKDLDLDLDLYLPKDDGTATRPLLVLIHGGAFYNGDKKDIGYPEWARYFAGLGYVVASVNYRLGFSLFFPTERAGFRAVQDVNAAIRYLVHHKGKYNIDPKRVFVAGTSAGGITALNVAFLTDDDRPEKAKKDGLITDVNPTLKDRFSIRAVGNMWGAVNNVDIISNSRTAVVSFHSSGDPIVPFEMDHPFRKVLGNEVMFPVMYGSKYITDAARGRTKLYSYDLPGTHNLHCEKDKSSGEQVLNSRFYEIEHGMRDFFSSVMLPHPFKPVHKEDNSQTFTYDKSDIASIYWKVEGGVILSQDEGCVQVLFLPGQDPSLIASGTYTSGLTFYKSCY